MRSFKSTAAGVGEANSAIGLVHHSVRPLYLSTAGGNFNNREILLCRIVTFGRIIYNVAYSYDTKCFCNFCGARSDLSFVIFPKANTPNANSFVIFDRKTHMNMQLDVCVFCSRLRSLFAIILVSPPHRKL